MKSKMSMLIGIYEVIGGIWGAGIVILNFPMGLQNHKLFVLLVSLFALTLYALSFIGGFFCAKVKEMELLFQL